MLYLCSPKLRSLQELQDVGLHLADLAQHDVTRDLILLNQQRLAEMELTNQLERKKVGSSMSNHIKIDYNAITVTMSVLCSAACSLVWH